MGEESRQQKNHNLTHLKQKFPRKEGEEVELDQETKGLSYQLHDGQIIFLAL